METVYHTREGAAKLGGNVNEHQQYLENLQRTAERNHTADLYLWPRTPISNLQAEAWQRVGVSDWRVDDARSRPAKVVATIDNLLYSRLIPTEFTYLDICCGDGVILWQVKAQFSLSDCYGVDLNAGRILTHGMVRNLGVELYRCPIQRFFRSKPAPVFDLVSMFNTYRGWQSADLRPDEQWIPHGARNWFREFAQFTILTVTEEQITELKEDGFWVTDIGKGEDDSRMVLIFPCQKGEHEGLWAIRRQPS